MAANYPGLDPRMSLLGLNDDGVTYKTIAYGYELIRLPSRLAALGRKLFNGFAIGALWAIMVKQFWG